MSIRYILDMHLATGRRLLCDITIIDLMQPTIIMTERDDNPGPSVTNASEYIATRVMKDMKFNPGLCSFVEHYDRTDRRDCIPTWDKVSYKWVNTEKGWNASSPSWSPIAGSQVEIIVKRMESDDETDLMGDIADKIMETDEDKA